MQLVKQCHDTIVCGVMRLVGMRKAAEGIRTDGEMHVTSSIWRIQAPSQVSIFSEVLCWVCLLGLVTSAVVQTQYWHYTGQVGSGHLLHHKCDKNRRM